MHNHDLYYRETLSHVDSRPEGVVELIPYRNYADAIDAAMKPYIDAYNKTAVAYKKIGVLKVRTEDFPKNTLRKIMRFKLDMTID